VHALVAETNDVNRWLLNAAAVSVLLMAAVSPLVAAERVSDRVLACAAEADEGRRLACFDALSASLRGDARPAVAGTASPAATSGSSPATTVVPTAPAEAAAAAPAAQSVSASAEDRFGLRLKEQKAGELTELSATATAIKAKPRGELIITLDNGQVWGEIAPGSKIKVNAGDTVKIEAGTLGSFILLAPNGRSSKVARIR